MRILITGTYGFIGTNLAYELGEYENVLKINEDIFKYDNWTDVLSNYLNNFHPDAIFHVGACSDTLETDVNYMMTRNYEFTRILSDWSKENDCKLIYSSSAANYGTNNLYPSNLYGWSKYVAEQYVVANGGIGLRYFNVYGPYENNKGKMASVAYQMLQKQKNDQEIKLFPKEPKRDFVYVKDVVDANLHALENYWKLKGNWYEVGSGEARTFEDVMNILEIPFTYTSEEEIPNGYQFYTCSDHAKHMDDWYPKWNLEKGLTDYLFHLR